MPTAKEQTRNLLNRLPDDCTFEEIQEALYVLDKIQQAEESIERNGSVPHDEARRRMAAMWSRQ